MKKCHLCQKRIDGGDLKEHKKCRETAEKCFAEELINPTKNEEISLESYVAIAQNSTRAGGCFSEIPTSPELILALRRRAISIARLMTAENQTREEKEFLYKIGIYAELQAISAFLLVFSSHTNCLYDRNDMEEECGGACTGG